MYPSFFIILLTQTTKYTKQLTMKILIQFSQDRILHTHVNFTLLFC